MPTPAQSTTTPTSLHGLACLAALQARWQAYDFSSCMYETQTHPCGRSHSRKLSDLPPLADLSPALEADAGHHAQPQAQLQQPHSPSKLGPRGAGAARLTDDEAAPLDVVGGSPIVAASG